MAAEAESQGWMQELLGVAWMGSWVLAWMLQPFLDLVLKHLFQHISNTEDEGKSVELGMCDTHRTLSR